MPDSQIPPDTAFECLGWIEFNGASYLGYRTRLVGAFAVMVPQNGALGETVLRGLLKLAL
jgi:hypothetical protein